MDAFANKLMILAKDWAGHFQLGNSVTDGFAFNKIITERGNKNVDLIIIKMPTETETALNAGERNRKAQALIVEHLDLNPVVM